MLEEVRLALVITRREVRDQFRDWRIIFPVVGLTLFFPFLMNFTAQQIVGFVQQYGAPAIGERLIPFLLMIVGFFPISTSLVIALETFVGEKERGSIEPLLNSPLKDWQIYLGKLLSATVPPLLSSFLGMSVYLIGLVINGIPLPEPSLMFQIICLTVVQAVLMVAGAVVVSSQATSVRAANLLASFIVIPVALLIQGESVVMFWGDYQILWWAVAGLGILAALLVRVGLAHFRREELLGRDIDVLNVRWMWKVFRNSFMGDAKNIVEWYRILGRKTLKNIEWPVLLMTGLVIAGVLIGITQVDRFFIPLKGVTPQEIQKQINLMIKILPINSFQPVLLLLWQNVRVLILSMVLGIFSLGILGVIPVMATMAITGYLFELLSQNGLPVITFIGFLLPHGLLEIPAAILAGAAVLKAGALLATPTPDKTVGEVMIESLAEWTRIMVGVVIPMLFVAACLEAWVTPRFVNLLLQ